jgi:hypothetical protein
MDDKLVTYSKGLRSYWLATTFQTSKSSSRFIERPGRDTSIPVPRGAVATGLRDRETCSSSSVKVGTVAGSASDCTPQTNLQSTKCRKTSCRTLLVL